MQSTMSSNIEDLWGIKKKYVSKVLYLSLTFLFMTSCLVMWRPLKLSVFSKMVGAEHVPLAKVYSLAILIPLILLYSTLVDWLRRHQLLYVYTCFHAVGGILFFFLFSHPVYGFSNTVPDPSRLTGWFFYAFMESFDAFFATTFWSFADSVNNPKDAKRFYGFFVSGSKIGGMLTSLMLYLVLTYTAPELHNTLLPYTVLAGSFFLGCAAFSIYMLIKTVPDDYMHGYEQAYQFERGRLPEHETVHEVIVKKRSFLKKIFDGVRNSFEGLFLLINNPYVMGIFSLIFLYDIIIVMVEFAVALSASASHQTVGSLTAFYASYYFFMNSLGLLISLFGTTPLLRLVGLRASLFIFPFLALIFFCFMLMFPSEEALFILLVLLRAFNYALNHPTREILYIPTTKDIKFKAKTWTDAFGSRIAKTTGSAINLSIKHLPVTAALTITMSLSLSLSLVWIVITYFLGKTAQKAIDLDHLIGDNQTDNHG